MVITGTGPSGHRICTLVNMSISVNIIIETPEAAHRNTHSTKKKDYIVYLETNDRISFIIKKKKE